MNGGVGQTEDAGVLDGSNRRDDADAAAADDDDDALQRRQKGRTARGRSFMGYYPRRGRERERERFWVLLFVRKR